MLSHKKFAHIKMTITESQDATQELVMKDCKENASTAVPKNCKAWHKRLGHCGNETLHESLPYIIGLNEEAVNS